MRDYYVIRLCVVALKYSLQSCVLDELAHKISIIEEYYVHLK